MVTIGVEIYLLLKRLWPLNRSITGDGVRQTLAILREHLPDMVICEVPSGTKAFDWDVPKEWRVNKAYITTPSGDRICDFQKNNLHLVGYSAAVHKKIMLSDLQSHLHSLPNQPSAIPYVTSYYQERWGFCISEDERIKLQDGEYEVCIESELFLGSLTYGEYLIKGSSQKEVLISTYVCHPSMANNELSGPCVSTYLARWLNSLKERKYSYRIIFIPETIGSIVYLSKNLDRLKRDVFAGFNVSCVGDDRSYSYLPSRRGNTISDKVARHVLRWIDPSFHSYGWSQRGSDERQYCAPNVDLPIASIMRTKYGEYPEYHTSLDNLELVVSPKGLEGGFNALKCAIQALECNTYPVSTVLGEPQLGKRGLYPTLSTKISDSKIRVMMDVISWADGETSLLSMAEKINVPIWELYPIIDTLVMHKLITLNEDSAMSTNNADAASHS
jgi:aminopeptidase-like protein